MTRFFALVQRLRCGRSLAAEQLMDNGVQLRRRQLFDGGTACDAFHEDMQVVVMPERRIRQAKLTAQRIDVFYPVFFLSLSAHGCSPFLALRFRLRVVDVDPERIPCFNPCIYPVQQLSRLTHQRRTVQLFRHLDELRVSHALQKCDGVRLAEICHQGAGKPVAHYAEFQAAAFTCELGPVCAHIFLYFSGQPFVPVLQSRLPLFVLSLQVVNPPFLLHIQLCQREPAFPHLLQRSVHGRPIPKHRDFFNFRSCHMYPHPFSKNPPSAFSGLGTGPGPIRQGAALRPGHSPGCGIFCFTLASSTGAYFSPHDRRRTKAPTFSGVYCHKPNSKRTTIVVAADNTMVSQFSRMNFRILLHLLQPNVLVVGFKVLHQRAPARPVRGILRVCLVPQMLQLFLHTLRQLVVTRDLLRAHARPLPRGAFGAELPL
nr:MAG TPA: hypothetical protein [Caudoviricetes sp.]